MVPAKSGYFQLTSVTVRTPLTALYFLALLSRGPARGASQPAALREPMRAGGAGFFYHELPQHIPTPRRHDVAVGRAYLEAAAAAIADSLEALREAPG